MKILLALLLLAGTAHAAPGFGVVLTNDSTKIRIALADLPGAKDRFLVTWDDLPGDTAAGAMVFYRDQDQHETRYFAVGGGGPFALVVAGQHTLIDATLLPVFHLVLDDPNHPTTLVARSGKQLDPAAMLARYR
ncbi:MAG TPA: hypothetical protein VFK02_34820, partial [Kofleriaceae bacterium]|nr:hypothetical protein [Kofleriaceae bacterium]